MVYQISADEIRTLRRTPPYFQEKLTVLFVLISLLPFPEWFHPYVYVTLAAISIYISLTFFYWSMRFDIIVRGWSEVLLLVLSFVSLLYVLIEGKFLVAAIDLSILLAFLFQIQSYDHLYRQKLEEFNIPLGKIDMVMKRSSFSRGSIITLDLSFLSLDEFDRVGIDGELKCVITPIGVNSVADDDFDTDRSTSELLQTIVLLCIEIISIFGPPLILSIPVSNDIFLVIFGVQGFARRNYVYNYDRSWKDDIYSRENVINIFKISLIFLLLLLIGKDIDPLVFVFSYLVLLRIFWIRKN